MPGVQPGISLTIKKHIALNENYSFQDTLFHKDGGKRMRDESGDKEKQC